MNSNESKIMVAIDRFEGDEKVFAILELPDLDHILIPAEYLPNKAQEGDWLEIKFTIDKKKRTEMEDEIKNLQKKMI